MRSATVSRRRKTTTEPATTRTSPAEPAQSQRTSDVDSGTGRNVWCANGNHAVGTPSANNALRHLADQRSTGRATIAFDTINSAATVNSALRPLVGRTVTDGCPSGKYSRRGTTGATNSTITATTRIRAWSIRRIGNRSAVAHCPLRPARTLQRCRSGRTSSPSRNFRRECQKGPLYRVVAVQGVLRDVRRAETATGALDGMAMRFPLSGRGFRVALW